MTIEDEIAAVKAAAERKLRRLRERERKQQQVVDARVLTLLREKHAGLVSQVEAEARRQMQEETAQRSTRARTSRAVPPPAVQAVGGGGVPPLDERSPEHRP